MPRTFNLTCDRYLVDKVTPGNRVKIVGILCTFNKSHGADGNARKQITDTVKASYIRVLGI